MNTRAVEVRIWGRTVGAAARDPATGCYAFENSPSWRRTGIELAPAYDVTHAHNPLGEWTARHLMGVNGKFDAITRADLHDVSPQKKARQRRALEETPYEPEGWAWPCMPPGGPRRGGILRNSLWSVCSREPSFL